MSASIIRHFSLFLEHPIFNSSSTFLCEYMEYIFHFEGDVLCLLKCYRWCTNGLIASLRAPSAFASLTFLRGSGLASSVGSV